MHRQDLTCVQTLLGATLVSHPTDYREQLALGGKLVFLPRASLPKVRCSQTICSLAGPQNPKGTTRQPIKNSWQQYIVENMPQRLDWAISISLMPPLPT